ncbi:MAG: hypothetical protein H6624_16050 [Bdellovibrionaceae bacterium]|nr:hypothetical protein [Bdellovibrionales bacterium]MCB9085861.1 hypothetical protein [Pseudobdellovibrionaceae bacterium]
MKKWDSLIEEKPSREHQSQVFKTVLPELQDLARQKRRAWWWQSLVTGSVWSSAAAVVLGVVLVPKILKRQELLPKEDGGSQLATNFEILDDMELLEELDLIDELDFLEAASELDEVEG